MIRKIIRNNPLIVWLLWIRGYLKLIKTNKGKNIKVGYLTKVINSKLGKYCTFYDNVLISNSTIGDFVYVSNDTNISHCSIGNFCSIGPNVTIGLGIHPTDHISTFPAFYSKKKQCQLSFVDENLVQERKTIKIGNDVWIGKNVMILDGVEISDGAIIATGAVVVKDVLPFSIVGGIPAKHIKFRFSESEIDEIISIAWWDKPLSWIMNNAPNFCNLNSFKNITKTQINS